VNREQFIAGLEKALLRLPKADRDDILTDFEAHFERGIAEGKTEEQVSAELGNPSELAQTYLENLPEGAKGTEYIPIVTNHEPQSNTGYTYVPPKYESEGSREGSSEYAYVPPKGSTDGSAPVGGTLDRGGAIAAVVLISLFVAVPVVSTIVGAWFSLLGIAIGAFGVSTALVVAGVAGALASPLLCIGCVLLSLAAVAFGALVIVGCVAAVKGIVWLIKWYVDFCKKLINGGAF